MRVLIAGGAGFVGSHLSRRWHDAGHDVFVVDNFLTGGLANLDDLIGQRRFRLIEEDITQPGIVERIPPVDVIYHLASPASPVHYQKFSIHTLEANSLGSMHLSQVALRWSARLVYTSTSEVYGDPLVHPQPEEYWGNVNPTGVRACYDEAKRFGEAYLMESHRKFGLNCLITRLFNTYGPNMQMGDGRMIPNFLVAALTNRPLVVDGDGSQTRSLCYVDDMITALERTALRGDPCTVINLGNEQELTVLEIAQMAIRVTGSQSRIVHGPRREDDPMQRRPKTERARSILDWQPQTDLETGMALTARWFASQLVGCL